MPDRELLYCWVAAGFNVLVPKKGGKGYLRVPYGHHHDQALSAIADAASVDVTGLDGALAFECGGGVYHGGDAARTKFAAIVVPRLEKHYGLAAREIQPNEFWLKNPLMTPT